MKSNFKLDSCLLYDKIVEILQKDNERINHDLLKQYIEMKIGYVKEQVTLGVKTGSPNTLTLETLRYWAKNFVHFYMKI